MSVATIAALTWLLRFALQQSFSDPRQTVKTENGEMPYGAFRFNQIIEECFYISKAINTSYLDLMEISVKEKNTMIEIINEENRKNQEEIEKIKRKAKM